MDDELYSLIQDDDESEYVEDFLEQQPKWTISRIIFTIVILITLIAFLAYSLQGLFFQPPMPAPPTHLPPMI